VWRPDCRGARLLQGEEIRCATGLLCRSGKAVPAGRRCFGHGDTSHLGRRLLAGKQWLVWHGQPKPAPRCPRRMAWHRVSACSRRTDHPHLCRSPSRDSGHRGNGFLQQPFPDARPWPRGQGRRQRHSPPRLGIQWQLGDVVGPQSHRRGQLRRIFSADRRDHEIRLSPFPIRLEPLQRKRFCERSHCRVPGERLRRLCRRRRL
jgi:hypothetical protein